MLNPTNDTSLNWARIFQKRGQGLEPNGINLSTAGLNQVPVGTMGAFSANAPTIMNGLDTQLRQQIDAGEQLKSFSLQRLLGSPLSMIKPQGAAAAKEGIEGGLEKTPEGAKMPGIANMVQGGIGLATGIMQISDINNSGMNDMQKRMARADTAVNAISETANAFGPVGTAIGAGLNILNSVGGALIGTPKVVKDFQVNSDVATSGGYGGITANAQDTLASGQSYQKAGLFGKLFGGRGKLKNQANASNAQQSYVSGIVADNNMAINTAAASQGMSAGRYGNQVNGYNRNFTNGSIMFGQEGGIIYNAIQKPVVEQLDVDGLDLTNTKGSSLDRSRIRDIVAQREAIELENNELENKLNNATTITDEPVAAVTPTATTGDSKFQQFESASLARLQKLHPGRKVEITYEKGGVYNEDGSRDWETQAALLKKGASKTALSLHNFGAAKDYRLKIDGKVISPNNKGLYKSVLWDAAKETGLHTVGDWDVAHIGLAQEGKGTTWKDLSQNYPDIFKGKRAVATIESLKKHGQNRLLNQLAHVHKDGGKIHIKKKNEGKFTEYKKRTGKTTEEAKHSKDPKVRKMANFAANAKKWKHENGGVLELYKQGGTLKPKNVIVHGKLHAHKHSLKEIKEFINAEITHKGIPVITKDAEGGVIQHSEVEGKELILHYDLTMKLEELRKDGSDEAIVKAGKLLARELMRNTNDKTGTLRSIRDRDKNNG